MENNTHTLTYEGQLTPDDMRQLTPVHFDVPDGITQINFDFSFTPKHPEGHQFPNQISLMVYDPDGPRLGISKPRPEGSFINAINPSPGGMPHPITSGRWTVYILVYRLLTPHQPAEYTLTITMSTDKIKGEPRQFPRGKVASRGRGWYRGDLHAHSIHSDGSWDIPELVQFWRDRKVDFMTLSDHDTISGLAQVRSLADDDLLTLGGIEISTFLGHCVAVGVHEWFDWRTADGEKIPIPEIAKKVIATGALFTIAHPRDKGEPWCCGCRWLHEDMMPGNALAVEIWNGYWGERNEEALRLFYSWLNQGHRIVATSGTDIHRPPPENIAGHGAVNVVYAEDLTEKAIIDGIKAGHSYISAGPELDVSARSSSGVEGMVGDTLPSEPVDIMIGWKDAKQGSMVRLIVDGMPYAEMPAGELGEISWAITKTAKWCTVEIRERDTGLWAVTNPILFK
jgi:hypothetical protein